MRRLILSLLAFVLCTAGSCNQNLPPNASPEMKTAKYAGDAMIGVREVQRLTEALHKSAIISEAQTANVMAVSIKVGEGGVGLAHALRIYHAASDLVSRNLALIEVNAALDTIDRELKKLLVPIDETGQKAKFIDLITEIVRAVWNVRILLPQGGAA